MAKMAKMLLTIQHNERVFSPPVIDGIKIEWERTGSPGKLIFTTIKEVNQDMSFSEGDPVCFYYDNKSVFMGYVFTKKRDREGHIEVTCYDQIRYLKNKYTYLFEKKTASQIIFALCDDLNLKTGEFDNTGYVIPAVAEENKSALDIALDVLEDTLLNTGNMYVLYDDFGKLQIKNVANMVSSTLICEDTAENFNYASSIDSETYNSIVLYYKNKDESIRIFSASSPSTISQWGTLRYFEEVKNPTVGMNKAKALLSLYNKKSRELTISGAFGDTSIRGGTLIPIKLNLGDIVTNNYMLVEKVTHNFENDHYTMDLSVSGYWEDNDYDTVYYENGAQDTAGDAVGDNLTGATVDDTYIAPQSPTTTQTTFGGVRGGGGNFGSGRGSGFGIRKVTVTCNGIDRYAGDFYIQYTSNGKTKTAVGKTDTVSVFVDHGSTVTVRIHPNVDGYTYTLSNIVGSWEQSLYKPMDVASGNSTSMICNNIQQDSSMILKWVR